MSTSLQIREHESLARYTSWKIGGPARYLVDTTTPEQLQQALNWAQHQQLPVFVLGGGSNVLISDQGFPGLVIRYRNQELTINEQGQQALVTIGAGAPMAGTVRKLTRLGWRGLEWAEGVPGTIGGAVVGNAGCYGGEIADCLTQTWVWYQQQLECWPVTQLAYGYRTSRIKQWPTAPAPIVLAAEFRLERDDQQQLGAAIERIAQLRRSKSPTGQSCGSVFKNPVGESAGRLIEAAGLKGTVIGGAEVSDKHANYIINRGDAHSADVLALIRLIRDTVWQQFGVRLELEVQLVGERV